VGQRYKPQRTGATVLGCEDVEEDFQEREVAIRRMKVVSS
jgi:hypothetical protein